MSEVDSRIFVCPLSKVGAVVQLTGASHLISILESERLPNTPPGISPAAHLRIATDDFPSHQDASLSEKGQEEIGTLVQFAESWPKTRPLVVHCVAGLSRSTAAAFVVLCALNRELSALTIAERLRRASAFADPDPGIVALGDAVLNRNGEMQRAIRSVGESLPAAIGRPFWLPSRVATAAKSADSSWKAA